MLLWDLRSSHCTVHLLGLRLLGGEIAILVAIVTAKTLTLHQVLEELRRELLLGVALLAQLHELPGRIVNQEDLIRLVISLRGFGASLAIGRNGATVAIATTGVAPPETLPGPFDVSAAIAMFERSPSQLLLDSSLDWCSRLRRNDSFFKLTLHGVLSHRLWLRLAASPFRGGLRSIA
jgi:hypothetical protein